MEKTGNEIRNNGFRELTRDVRAVRSLAMTLTQDTRNGPENAEDIKYLQRLADLVLPDVAPMWPKTRRSALAGRLTDVLTSLLRHMDVLCPERIQAERNDKTMQKDYRIREVITDLESVKRDIDSLEKLRAALDVIPDPDEKAALMGALVKHMVLKKPIDVECVLTSSANMLRSHQAALEAILNNTSVKWPPAHTQ